MMGRHPTKRQPVPRSPACSVEVCGVTEVGPVKYCESLILPPQRPSKGAVLSPAPTAHAAQNLSKLPVLIGLCEMLLFL